LKIFIRKRKGRTTGGAENWIKKRGNPEGKDEKAPQTLRKTLMYRDWDGRKKKGEKKVRGNGRGVLNKQATKGMGAKKTPATAQTNLQTWGEPQTQ